MKFFIVIEIIILFNLFVQLNCECDSDDIECHEKEKYKKGIF